MENGKRKTENSRKRTYPFSVAVRSLKVCLVSFCLVFTACSELEKPKTEPFYAETAPPPKKEFRWSNGKTPKTFDPAEAAAPPETDVVRAVYEGLTETDPKNLKAIPATAIDWKSSEDLKTWTFNLRKNAKWSNGERVTANDFVRSWKRLADLSDKIAHRELVQNIAGFQIEKVADLPVVAKVTIDILPKFPVNNNLLPLPKQPSVQNQSNSNSAIITPKPSESNTNTAPPNTATEETPETPFGVEAIDDFTLKVSLLKPDKDFPALVAHPIFRPIYGDGKDFETEQLNAAIVTNGAFRITSVGQDGITLDRAENYWNREAVELERVKLVPTGNAEKALEAYRAGEIDAVTNVDFEPLALKLLATYEDFQRTPHAAINFYEFNRNNAPFDDKRVREALAISIERERITEDEMDGASKSAFNFTPFDDQNPKLAQDAQKAKNLLTESGFPNGENFPTVRLLVNRNNMQQKIARLVAKMWKKHLNIETEIVVKDAGELGAAWESDEYDLLRRGAVLPTTDEAMNMAAIFAPEKEVSPVNKIEEPGEKISPNGNPDSNTSVSTPEQPKLNTETNALPNENSENPSEEGETISTEEAAIDELPAIPLYFSTSYSLVKPYIQGFDINILDAPLLKNVKIDNNWQPKKAKSES
jgi:oligopeptide transport system substrate-binding protein